MTVLIDVPVGMLRISQDLSKCKPGTKPEPDRVIYPCHAERWAELGWTVHPPVIPEGEGDTEPDPTGNGGGGGGGNPNKPTDDLVLGTDNDLVALVPSDVNPDNPAPVEPEPSDPGTDPGTEPSTDPGTDTGTDPGTDPAAAEPPAAALQVLDFEAMTKAEIIAACETHYGLTLDSHMTKAELVEEATKLASETQPAETAPDPVAEGDGSIVPDLL